MFLIYAVLQLYVLCVYYERRVITCMFKRSCVLYLHIIILSVCLKHTGCISMSQYLHMVSVMSFICVLINIYACKGVYSVCQRVT